MSMRIYNEDKLIKVHKRLQLNMYSVAARDSNGLFAAMKSQWSYFVKKIHHRVQMHVKNGRIKGNITQSFCVQARVLGNCFKMTIVKPTNKDMGSCYWSLVQQYWHKKVT